MLLYELQCQNRLRNTRVSQDQTHYNPSVRYAERGEKRTPPVFDYLGGAVFLVPLADLAFAFMNHFMSRPGPEIKTSLEQILK